MVFVKLAILLASKLRWQFVRNATQKAVLKMALSKRDNDINTNHVVTRQTVKHRGISPHIKRQALELYLEGLGFRSIGRCLKYSHVAAYNWIKAYGESIDLIRSDGTAEIVELDEMHTYTGSKQTIAGFGLLLIEMKSNSSIAKWVPAIPKQGKSYGLLSKVKT